MKWPVRARSCGSTCAALPSRKTNRSWVGSASPEPSASRYEWRSAEQARTTYPLSVELPPYLQDYRAALLRHPAAEWAIGIYRLHRGRSAEIPRRTATAD